MRQLLCIQTVLKQVDTSVALLSKDLSSRHIYLH